MLLWLKIGGLAGVRQVAPGQFSWAAFAAAIIAGAIVMIVAQLLWASIASWFLGAEQEVAACDLRLVWGVAGFPQAVSLLLLLPLDLSIAGPASYTTARLGDSLALTWAAGSIALAVALGAWSLFLFVSGLRAATGSGHRPTLAAVTFGAIACVAVVVAAFSAALIALARVIE